jgi:glycosyltransferase involved in cell wall biosynthesis
MPLVAVVTPVYNGARYLAETMDCVQAQTYSNLVHVVLDNASTDDTPNIIARYQNGRVPIITARNPETVPLAENWDRALKRVPAEAGYFRVLCADDKMIPTAIAETVAVGAANPNVGVIGCGFQVMDKAQTGRWPPGVSVIPGREAVRRIFMGEGEIIGPHLMMRADFLAKRDPFYDFTCHANDAEACFYLLQHSDWANTDAILGWTRVHDESVTHNVMHRWGMHFMDWIRFLDTYGRWAMTPEDYAKHRRAYFRYYYRRLMLWRMQPHGAEKTKSHFDFLRTHDRVPNALDFADAFADLALKRLKLAPAPPRSGHPLG